MSLIIEKDGRYYSFNSGTLCEGDEGFLIATIYNVLSITSIDGVEFKPVLSKSKKTFPNFIKSHPKISFLEKPYRWRMVNDMTIALFAEREKSFLVIQISCA